MAVVLPHKGVIVVPIYDEAHFDLLDSCFVTQRIKLADGDVVALPHHPDTIKMLNNLGINTDRCDMFDHYYEPPTVGNNEAWWWQLETASFLSKNNRAFVTSTPRTGKTLSTLLALDFLQQQGEGSALIVAPLTVANGGEWVRTLNTWFPHKEVVFVHKDRENQLKQHADVYIINPDGVKIAIKQLVSMAKSKRITIAVFDELTEFANPSSQRWKSAKLISDHVNYCWGLTGTPSTPAKIYGQVKLINPDKVPRYFKAWRDMTELQVNQFKWVPRKGHKDVIKQAMSPCIRFDKEQLMSIPTPKVINEYVELSEEQQRLSDKLLNDLRAMVNSKTIDAVNASALATKLLQVASGVVKTADGDVVNVDCQEKLNVLMKYIKINERKKVVFSNFTAVNDMLVDYIRQQGYTCEKVDGSITGNKRAKILNDFLDRDDPHVLVCHPRTTAFGVELASADHIICFGVPLSGTFIYQQMFERLSSARQTASETFVVHIASGGQDKVSFANLSKGVAIERNIVDIFTKELLK